MSATAEPIFELVDPSILLVDEQYQRDMSPAGLALIRRMVGEWDWAKFKPPTAVLTEAGLELIDGQHTSIAAVTHPGISVIPVQIVTAPEVEDRAKAFIGINRDRIAVTTAQLHHAAVAAGDKQAVAIAEVAREAGAKILHGSPGAGLFKPRDTLAVAALGALIAEAGRDRARQVLAILVDAGLAPIRTDHIKALHLLLTEPDFAALDVEAAPSTIRSMNGTGAADREAKAFAETHRIPRWRALASVWFKAAKKRRAGSEQAAGAPPSRHGAPTVDGREPRPAFGGWQPGRFSRRCRHCDQLFTGAQAATSCEPCACAETEAA
ncbi:hypothetical protein [Kaistia soli]|nr:hypothetical protein [Kaistia soli]